ncbi:hypothetical protein HYH02_002388 [Chlamydomonas schloesseri]|uniref:Uncharacterized protein n=1 Tax=Chlamydomonas schloesseri TaxID=2026947 RepID=A0A836BAX1_9CHLO|nr:hypothetical protein HYH02_002387 [Chlamydomonas schloesseri]KAG2453053.1 hypothetical protein HYH02_002388 [Chlamydomonas schloesseri]|eukprot:KAG2453052.1 hypothetical protein HYH02_002387 [Chlamydomonas schloesseri]
MQFHHKAQGTPPYRVAAARRTGKVLGWNAKQKPWTHAVFFGWNVVSRTPGLLSVGDVLTPVSQQQPADMVPAP